MLRVQVRCEWRQCCWCPVSFGQAAGQVAAEGHAAAAKQDRQGGDILDVDVLTLRGCAGSMLRVYTASKFERSGEELAGCMEQL